MTFWKSACMASNLRIIDVGTNLRSEGQMRKCWALSVVALLLASTAWAVPVTFIHSAAGGTFAGTLDGVGFSVEEFTITALGDTDDRQASDVDTFFINHTSAEIEIPGLGTFDIITPSRTFVNQSANAVGFSRSSGADLFNQTAFDPVYTTYDLLSSIGPEFADGGIFQWALSDVVTSGGVLLFENRSAESASFQAIVEGGPGPIPEPGTLALLAMGLLALGRASRRRA
jgi:hypothetical protein